MDKDKRIHPRTSQIELNQQEIWKKRLDIVYLEEENSEKKSIEERKMLSTQEKEETIQQGERIVDMAKKLLETVSVEDISKNTGLSLDKAKEMRDKILSP